MGALSRALGTTKEGAAPVVILLSQKGESMESLCGTLATHPLPGEPATSFCSPHGTVALCTGTKKPALQLSLLGQPLHQRMRKLRLEDSRPNCKLAALAPTLTPGGTGGVVVVLGDDRGLSDEDEAAIEKKVRTALAIGLGCPAARWLLAAPPCSKWTCLTERERESKRT